MATVHNDFLAFSRAETEKVNSTVSWPKVNKLQYINHVSAVELFQPEKKLVWINDVHDVFLWITAVVLFQDKVFGSRRPQINMLLRRSVTVEKVPANLRGLEELVCWTSATCLFSRTHQYLVKFAQDLFVFLNPNR